ncbi:hypothetical protein GCM10010967_48670 [Dyadobacter beijingensis]|uniref:T9SS type A sorting domain-containing protein n=1 Tax=Dyadobacter beijingensis TaxID=365489 RepID=A0ABQ2IFL5_9BACT|nr:T9SS type A sorting domain-containing protein [Dyadobacter beijingensis]GGN07360.1 hypothetical protein GCM10010967_48670 [Dyadobacter beijingensis]
MTFNLYHMAAALPLAVLRRLPILLPALLLTLAAAQAQSTWTGTASSDWNNAANWTPGLPDGTANIVIPDVSTNDPVIGPGQAIAANSVLIETGASLEINAGGSLSLNGSAPYSEPFTFGFTTALNNKGSIVNRGQLTIGDVGGVGSYGIVNQGSLETKAGSAIRIDRSTDTGLFNASGTLTNAGNMTIGGSEAVGLSGIWNDAVFNHSGGEIRIDRSSVRALMNNADETKSIHATFTNAAAIVIGAAADVGQLGIENHSEFSQQAGGTIKIDRTSQMAFLHSSGSFSNSGEIVIGSAAAVGLYGLSTQANADNNAGGVIRVDRTSKRGTTHGAGIFNNAGTIAVGQNASPGVWGVVNYPAIVTGPAIRFNNLPSGVIMSDRATESGLANYYGEFVNEGSIVIGSQDAADKLTDYGVDGGNILNAPSGHIRIDRTGKMGFRCAGFNTNEGKITIGGLNAPMGGDGFTTWGGTFNNMPGAELVIDRTPAVGLNVALGRVNNQSTVTIGENAGVGTYALVVQGVFNNQSGSVNVGYSDSYGIWIHPSGLFDNSSVVAIGSATNAATYGFFIRGTLKNNANGVVKIDRTTANGLLNFDGTVTNDGELTIGSEASPGTYGLVNRAAFHNNAGGRIHIDRASDTGLYNYSIAKFNNAGAVRIGASEATGVHGIFNEAEFNNNAGGSIGIDRTSLAALRNFNGTFTNAASITIGSMTNAGTYGIRNQAAFANQAAGVIQVDRTEQGIFAENNTFNNAGSITVGQLSPIQPFITQQGTGAFTNSIDGILKGTGQIAAAGFTNAGGTVSPGYSPGIMTFVGDQAFGNGILEIEVNGITAAGTDFDQIIVQGTAALSGTLKLASTYMPVKGDEVTLLTATAITGTFETVAGLPDEWKVVYTSNAVKLQYEDPMPVTLIAFAARAAGNIVQLQWQTTAETNNAGFYIQRSSNGLQWEELGFVKGSGTTAVVQKYAYQDTEPKTGLNYYRLRQVDFDGTTELSGVRAVRVREPELDVTVWADAARQAHVKTDHVISQVTIYSLTGRVVAHAAAAVLDLSRASAGLHVVRVQTERGVVTRKLFLP